LDRVVKVPGFSSRKPLSPAAGLNTGIVIRPAEALHELSYVTRPRYQDDLYDRYVQWGLMRYLGFFAHVTGKPGTRALGVSAAGQRIRGSQRRVTSEDLGIGFGALLARRWFARSVGPVPVSIVDVDAALDDRVVYAAGSPLSVKPANTRRPDYILIANEPAIRTRYRVRVLECKGTSDPSRAVRQMARAAEQLGGLAIGGRVPAGLAVGTIASGAKVFYVAVDPDDEEEAAYEVNADTLGQAGDFQLRDNDTDIPALVLVSAALRASWATLADFGGNLGALDRWSPASMRRRLDRRTRERVTFDTPFGTAHGTNVTFTIDGQRLNVRHGIAQTVDQELIGGDHEGIANAQAEFAIALARRDNTVVSPPEPPEHEDTDQEGLFHADDPVSETDPVFSATADGSIFSLSLE
jgi:hypothetical protein